MERTRPATSTRKTTSGSRSPATGQGRHHRLRAAAARRRRLRRAPEVGTKLKAGQSFGTIESVKAVSELYAPVAGEVVEVNAALKDKPEAVNSDPHASWMIVLRLANAAEAAALLDAAQYATLVK